MSPAASRVAAGAPVDVVDGALSVVGAGAVVAGGCPTGAAGTDVAVGAGVPVSRSEEAQAANGVLRSNATAVAAGRTAYTCRS